MSRYPDDQMTRFPTPPPYITSVENKSPTLLQPNGDRPVEVSFWPCFDLESRLFLFSALASCWVPVASCFKDEHPANHLLRLAQFDANVKRIFEISPENCHKTGFNRAFERRRRVTTVAQAGVPAASFARWGGGRQAWETVRLQCGAPAEEATQGSPRREGKEAATHNGTHLHQGPLPYRIQHQITSKTDRKIDSA